MKRFLSLNGRVLWLETGLQIENHPFYNFSNEVTSIEKEISTLQNLGNAAYTYVYRRIGSIVENKFRF